MDDLEKRSRCRGCGWLFSGPVWDEDPEEGATFDICPCCCCEAGNEDYTLESTRKYRQKWLDRGMPRHEYGSSRSGKEMETIREQMKNIPPEWL